MWCTSHKHVALNLALSQSDAAAGLFQNLFNWIHNSGRHEAESLHHLVGLILDVWTEILLQFIAHILFRVENHFVGCFICQDVLIFKFPSLYIDIKPHICPLEKCDHFYIHTCEHTYICTHTHASCHYDTFTGGMHFFLNLA